MRSASPINTTHAGFQLVCGSLPQAGQSHGVIGSSKTNVLAGPRDKASRLQRVKTIEMNRTRVIASILGANGRRCDQLIAVEKTSDGGEYTAKSGEGQGNSLSRVRKRHRIEAKQYGSSTARAFEIS